MATQLNALAECEQRRRHIALNEAPSHLKSSIELVEGLLRRSDNKRIKFAFGVPAPDYIGVVPGVATKNNR